jgi:hypothetical protein
VTEGDRDGVELAPALRHDRRGAFGQFGAQRSIWPSFFRNALCASTPCASAILAAPTFEEKVNTSDSVIERPTGWVS